MKMQIKDLGLAGQAMNQLVEFDYLTKQNGVVWAKEDMSKSMNAFITAYNERQKEVEKNLNKILEENGGVLQQDKTIKFKTEEAEAKHKEQANAYASEFIEMPGIVKSYDKEITPVRLKNALNFIFEG